MKVLFLDIDGVVNNEQTGPNGIRHSQKNSVIGIDPVLAFLVGQITLAVPDLNVVLSSAWRHSPLDREEVRQRVVPFIDTTGNIDYTRGQEIQTWLDAHPEVTRYAILDDDINMLPEQMPNVFTTSWHTGITPEIRDRVIAHLNG